jgi:hypothetical protein
MDDAIDPRQERQGTSIVRSARYSEWRTVREMLANYSAFREMARAA